MWEFIVKKVFPKRPQKESTDVGGAHYIAAEAATHGVERGGAGRKGEASGSRRRNRSAPVRILRCPVCQIEMVVRTIGSVEIDQCPGCEGIFLDRGELRSLSGTEEPHLEHLAKEQYLIYTPHGKSSHVS